ncbi:hypothetical protein BACPEC_00706 [[Bacteroides] pectinophilus ATCC 43243]|uniref:Uncharacterized protein n=1 Tax=[Bacteroides] pectinophilus ATCC 43243 TaxID=483218 RepID=B7APV0_9FIRM|nr:hypothetical protein BACPEC_00706 [[Bacteroides] pectinophilus ATCC 43243]
MTNKISCDTIRHHADESCMVPFSEHIGGSVIIIRAALRCCVMGD